MSDFANRQGELSRQIETALQQVRQNRPLAGSITNTVTINLVANAQLAAGGSAAMVYMPDEGETLAQLGGATYLNVGTIFPIYEETLPRTAETLHRTKKPWVLDPVAVGIGELRTELLKGFKQFPPAIVRGNASEVMALAGLWELEGGVEKSQVHGVDTTDSVAAAKEAAVALARWCKGAVAVSGEVDLVTDGNLVIRAAGGSHFFEKITGAGCSLAGVMALYLTAASPLVAALTGTQLYNVAGKKAEQLAAGPASFQTHFLDLLYTLSPQEISQHPFTIEEV